MPRVPFDLRTFLVLVFVGALSWTIREINHARIPLPERGTWVTSDKDTMYHLRRVERMFHEGLEGRDPYLNFPDGSAIPWPPYYTAIAWAWTAPGAPDGLEERHSWIERRVASLPRVFGVATSILVALGAIALAGPAAGLVAGTSHALSAASIGTSRVGNGDHHAFIAMLAAALLVLASRAFRESALADARGSAARGAGLGAICGIALGSWVASLLQILLLQAMLGWLVVLHSRRSLPGLPALGLALHASALVVVLPAVIVSPWNADQPWSVVNLTWFHALWIVVGGLVFVPLLRGKRGRLVRAYPLVVAAFLAAIAAAVVFADAEATAGIREGFAWLAREQLFMSVVGESRSLFRFSPVAVLGSLIFVLPLAWGSLAWQAFRKRRLELIPWAIAAPVLVGQAARQARFADLVAGPLAVVAAWGIVAAWRSGALAGLRARTDTLGPARTPVFAILLLLATLLAHYPVVANTWSVRDRGPDEPGVKPSATEVVVREFTDWLRENVPGPATESVLATWSWGHDIEWRAKRPSIATNFGTFIGAEAFAAPAYFFMSSDPREAEALLEERRARWVIATSLLPNMIGHLAYTAGRLDADRYLDTDEEGLAPRSHWYRTMGARLLFDGGLLRSDGSVTEPLDFLRLVSASRHRDPRFTMRPRPTLLGSLWERVPGATLEAVGYPGDELRVAISVSYPDARYSLTWTGRAIGGDDGVARMRVPYATDRPNGDGVASGPARWRFRGRTGQVAIPERAVREGGIVRIGES